MTLDRLPVTFRALFFVLLISGIVVAKIRVDLATKHYVDDDNRVRIFHGVNAVYKTAPYHPSFGAFDPETSLNEEDIRNLHSWGVNFIRLGMMWPGVEPQRGQYNMTYINVMKQLIETLQRYDIFVLLDCHQDLLSPKFCGEGVPDFAAIVDPLTPPFPSPSLFEPLPTDPNTGYPETKACLEYEFARFYLASATNSAFQNLYDDKDGIKQSFGAFWQLVAKNFAKYPNVMGYELINEPWAGDVYRNLKLLYPKYADLHNLQPFYDYLATQIRQIDEETLIFFEQNLVDNGLLDQTGFTHVPGGDQYSNRSVLSYHIYCGFTNRTGDPGSWTIVCDGVQDLIYEFAMKEVRRLGAGGFMTEFGALDDLPNGIDNIVNLLNMADTFQQSWSWWQYKSYNDITTSATGGSESFYNTDGSLQNAKVKALARTYPMAIAGYPKHYVFFPVTGIFRLTYTANNAATAPTIIYVCTEFVYPKGYNVVINPSNYATWSKTSDPNRVQINHVSTIPNGTVLEVIIVPM
jgi:endoglycosylceramidase